MKRTKTVISVTAVILAALLVFSLVQRLLEPKYMTSLTEGSMLSQYYGEAGGHDVIFVGDCEVYANVSPLEMYRTNGITAYVRGSSQQLIWQSYYVLEETLRYETPKAVVYNVNAMRYSEPVSEEYNRLTIDMMRWSKQKINIILASMTEEESFLSYVFPILRYHARFDELSKEDIEFFFKRQKTTFEGHLVNQGIKAVQTLPAKRPLADYEFGDICWDYLDKMRTLCNENGVELILMKAPSLYPYWYEQYDSQIAEYASKHGLKYYDFTKDVEKIGLDFSVDTYDAGLHLNLAGAVKFSRYFADILSREHGIADRRNDEKISAVYDAKLKEYDGAIKNGKEETK